MDTLSGGSIRSDPWINCSSGSRLVGAFNLIFLSTILDVPSTQDSLNAGTFERLRHAFSLYKGCVIMSCILSVSFAWGVLLSTSTDTLLGRIVAASNSSPGRLVDLVILLTSPSSDSKTCGTVAIEPLTSFVSPRRNSPGSI